MFACLLIPDFSVQAALRMEPNEKKDVLKQSPIAILDGPDSLLRVIAGNGPARTAGIEIGMTRLQAQSCGQAVLKKRCMKHEESAQIALLDCASAFSPRVESTAAGTVTLDLAGTEKLFGPLESTAHKLDLSARQFGFEAHIAIASSPDTSLYAALGFQGITIIPPGKEKERLAPLPLSVLSASTEAQETFTSWGIQDFKSLAKLPPVPLVERLGQEGLRLWQIVRGESNRVLVPAELMQDFIESFEFDDPVETLESLMFILNRLLQQACSRLAARSLATSEFRLILELEARQIKTGREKEFYERTWKLPLPIQDHKVLFRLACLDLEANTQSAPVRKLTIQAIPQKSRSAQRDLFAPASPEIEQLEITLARIRGVIGPADDQGLSCVGSPAVLDSHKPDSFSVRPFSAVEAKLKPVVTFHPIIALRRFRPALETSVEFHNKPISISLGNKRLHVLAASGPWRGSGHWWEATEHWARDEWDVALRTSQGAGHYRIYLDRARNQWFVEGMFD